MRPDVGLPVFRLSEDRDEYMFIFYDGFIKNTSEGIIRCMLEDYDHWIEKYPRLSEMEDLNFDQIYDNTTVYPPLGILYEISEGKRSVNDIITDINEILPIIDLNQLKLTSFEIALSKLLEEDNVKKVTLYRPYIYNENDLTYLHVKLDETAEKVELLSGDQLPTSFDAYTTICFNEYLTYVEYKNTYGEEIFYGKLVIILNTMQNVVYNPEERTFVFTEEFNKELESVNEKEKYGLITMYNFALLSETEEDHLNELLNDEFIAEINEDDMDEDGFVG